MKLKLPSLPFCLRSPRYRRNIKRRLAAPVGLVVFHDVNLGDFAREFERRDPATARIIRHAIEQNDREGYRRRDFTSGPCYLPPDAPRQASRWRWERDPVVIVSIIGTIVIGLALIALGGFLS